jgi:hypothetical protein
MIAPRRYRLVPYCEGRNRLVPYCEGRNLACPGSPDVQTSAARMVLIFDAEGGDAPSDG